MFNADQSKQINLIFKIGQNLYGHNLLNVRLESSLARSMQISFRTFFFGKVIETEQDTFKKAINDELNINLSKRL